MGKADILHYPISLEFLKEKKLRHLRMQCEHRILAGFSSTETKHRYAYSVYDQINMTQQFIQLLSDDSIVKIDWKTENEGVVTHTREEFMSIATEANAHKRRCLTLYQHLKERLNVARNIEELDYIEWE